MTTNEQTPLLGRDGSGNGVATKPWLRRVLHVENRILFAGFLITLSFSYTQVPLFYVFHLMECDVFYDTHPPYQGTGDRCSRNEIAAGTATQFSILGMSTTFCGTFNLFVTGWVSKRFGPRLALMMQTFVPAIRVLTQILGVVAGKSAGMMIIQATQLITIFGGPAGYILVVNIMAGELVEPMRRTAVFGMLQGAIMLGQGIGYLTGGMIGDAIDIRAPFDVAFVSFLVSCAYAYFCLPYIAPESMSSAVKPGEKDTGGFLAPLRILLPQRLRHPNGKITRHFGVIFLCAGIFLGVLATGYAPLLIQMYATAEFSFNQADNGWLMSEFAIMRSIFLLFMFPPIISWGRRRITRRSARVSQPAATEDGNAEAPLGHIPIDPGEFDATVGQQADQEPVQLPMVQDDREASKFDLVFLRWSLVVDGALTTVAAFATQRWHIYLGQPPRCLFTFVVLKLSQPLSCSHLGLDLPRRPRASSRRCAPMRREPTHSTPSPWWKTWRDWPRRAYSALFLLLLPRWVVRILHFSAMRPSPLLAWEYCCFPTFRLQTANLLARRMYLMKFMMMTVMPRA